MDLDRLNKAFYECAKISKWKESTQKYQKNIIENNLKLKQELEDGTYRTGPTSNFSLHERGKLRYIEAPIIRDRIVQKVLVQDVLLPIIRPLLIYDNYASLEYRGTSLARKRIDVMLHKYIKEYGDDGYILQIDIKKYFESIDHEILKEMLFKKVENYQELLGHIIDSTGKGLNLGSECPQVFAIFYLSGVDNFIKIVKGIKYYGRYMDDMFIIHKDKEYLKSLLQEIRIKLKEIKLQINEKKTHISKLSHGFTFLQIKYNLCDGKILKRPTRDKIIRERRRLKSFKGKMSDIEVSNCYNSWKYAIIKDSSACKRSIDKMDKLFNSLYKVERKKKKKRSEIFKEVNYEDCEHIRGSFEGDTRLF